MRVAFVLCGVVGVLGQSSVATAFGSHSTENEWQSATISALGGVGQLSENPADEFFSDPSLPAADSRKFVMQFLSQNFSFSEDLGNTVGDFQDIVAARDKKSDGVASTVNILDGVRSLFGKRLGAGFTPALLTLKMGGFSLVPYANVLVDSDVRVPSLPRAALLGDGYVGLGLGYARTFGSKAKWDVGLNVRPGMRGYVKGAVDVSAVGDMVGSTTEQKSTSEAGSSKYATYGAGFYLPVDVGFGLRPTTAWRFNLVARDVGGAPALSVVEGARPPVYPARLSLGATWRAFQNKYHQVLFGTDLQDLLKVGETSGLWYRWQWAAAYRATLPFRSQTTFGLNCGLQSGYPAFGVFLDLFAVKLEFSRSVRETGYYIGQKPETRFNARVSSQLSF